MALLPAYPSVTMLGKGGLEQQIQAIPKTDTNSAARRMRDTLRGMRCDSQEVKGVRRSERPVNDAPGARKLPGKFEPALGKRDEDQERDQPGAQTIPGERCQAPNLEIARQELDTQERSDPCQHAAANGAHQGGRIRMKELGHLQQRGSENHRRQQEKGEMSRFLMAHFRPQTGGHCDTGTGNARQERGSLRQPDERRLEKGQIVNALEYLLLLAAIQIRGFDALAQMLHDIENCAV